MEDVDQTGIYEVRPGDVLLKRRRFPRLLLAARAAKIYAFRVAASVVPPARTLVYGQRADRKAP